MSFKPSSGCFTTISEHGSSRKAWSKFPIQSRTAIGRSHGHALRDVVIAVRKEQQQLQHEQYQGFEDVKRESNQGERKQEFRRRKKLRANKNDLENNNNNSTSASSGTKKQRMTRTALSTATSMSNSTATKDGTSNNRKPHQLQQQQQQEALHQQLFHNYQKLHHLYLAPQDSNNPNYNHPNLRSNSRRTNHELIINTAMQNLDRTVNDYVAPRQNQLWAATELTATADYVAQCQNRLAAALITADDGDDDAVGQPKKLQGCRPESTATTTTVSYPTRNNTIGKQSTTAAAAAATTLAEQHQPQDRTNEENEDASSALSSSSSLSTATLTTLVGVRALVATATAATPHGKDVKDNAQIEEDQIENDNDDDDTLSFSTNDEDRFIPSVIWDSRINNNSHHKNYMNDNEDNSEEDLEDEMGAVLSHALVNNSTIAIGHRTVQKQQNDKSNNCTSTTKYLLVPQPKSSPEKDYDVDSTITNINNNDRLKKIITEDPNNPNNNHHHHSSSRRTNHELIINTQQDRTNEENEESSSELFSSFFSSIVETKRCMSLKNNKKNEFFCVDGIKNKEEDDDDNDILDTDKNESIKNSHNSSVASTNPGDKIDATTDTRQQGPQPPRQIQQPLQQPSMMLQVKFTGKSLVVRKFDDGKEDDDKEVEYTVKIVATNSGDSTSSEDTECTNKKVKSAEKRSPLLVQGWTHCYDGCTGTWIRIDKIAWYPAASTK